MKPLSEEMSKTVSSEPATKRKRGEDVRRTDTAYRIVQDLNDAGLLNNPWTQWSAAQKVVKKALNSRCVPAVTKQERENG